MKWTGRWFALTLHYRKSLLLLLHGPNSRTRQWQCSATETKMKTNITFCKDVVHVDRPIRPVSIVLLLVVFTLSHFSSSLFIVSVWLWNYKVFLINCFINEVYLLNLFFGWWLIQHRFLLSVCYRRTGLVRLTAPDWIQVKWLSATLDSADGGSSKIRQHCVVHPPNLSHLRPKQFLYFNYRTQEDTRLKPKETTRLCRGPRAAHVWHVRCGMLWLFLFGSCIWQ